MSKATLKSEFNFRNSNFNNGKELFVVINFYEGEEEKTRKAFQSLLKDVGSPLLSSPLNEYATILHLEDKDQNGKIEQPHIHLWLNMEKGASKQSWISAFADFLGLERTAVQIEVPESTDDCLRYLIHKGYAKTQHDKNEVITNVPTKCAAAWSEATKRVAFDIEEIVACESLRELVALTGLEKYHKAKELWNDLRAERGRTDEALKAEHDRNVIEWLKRHMLDLFGSCERIAKIAGEATKYTPKGSQYYETLWAIYNEAENARKMVSDYLNNGVIDEGE